MKKFLFLSACICFLASQSFATDADPNDYILVAYKLTDEQATAFKANDGKMTDFWNSAWTGRDYIDMNTEKNSYPGRDAWSGPDDARLTVKAAADAKGLYISMVVQDNTFIDPVEFTYRWDACDLYFDALSSEELKAGGDAVLVNPAWGFALSMSTQQFQVYMGGSTIPTSISYNFYDPQFFDWTFGTIAYTDIPTLYMGMAMESFRIDDTHKGQEWFIPWNYIGVTGLPAGTVLASKKFGFCGGYNDTDDPAAVEGTEKCLRWKNIDPYFTTLPMDSWGDIEMAADMPPVEGVGVHKSMVQHSLVKAGQVLRTELYNLKGEKIAAGTKLQKNTMIVERTILSNGKSTSRMIRVSN